MATLSSVLAWRILRTEELVGCGPWGRKELDRTKRLTHRHITWAHRFKDPPDTQPWSPGFKGQDKDPDPELGFSVGWEGSLHEGPTRAWEKPDRRNLKRHSMLQGSASAWPSVRPLKAEGDW